LVDEECSDVAKGSSICTAAGSTCVDFLEVLPISTPFLLDSFSFLSLCSMSTKDEMRPVNTRQPFS